MDIYLYLYVVFSQLANYIHIFVYRVLLWVFLGRSVYGPCPFFCCSRGVSVSV